MGAIDADLGCRAGAHALGSKSLSAGEAEGARGDRMAQASSTPRVTIIIPAADAIRPALHPPPSFVATVTMK
jgi:hypothetical protein